MKLIRFGIVGCGVVSQAHAASILALDGLELAGCYDHSAERSAEFAAQYGTKAYPSYSAMVADETIDAVCICTPSGLHADQAVQALREGKHVFFITCHGFAGGIAADPCIEKLKTGSELFAQQGIAFKQSNGGTLLCRVSCRKHPCGAAADDGDSFWIHKISSFSRYLKE